MKKLLLILLFVCPLKANAVELWQGVLAEAGCQGKQGMKAVALVVKNRYKKGLDSGLVALKRPDLKRFCAKQPKSLQRQAKEAVNEVFSGKCKDFTKGATHYENVQRFGKPKWARKMKVTVVLGKHTFYKGG